MRASGYSCVCKLRCSKGLDCDGLLANWATAPGSDGSAFELPRMSPDLAFAFGLKLVGDQAIEEDRRNLCVQVAVLYTNSRGQRFLRVHSTLLNVVSSLNAAFRSVSVAPLMALAVKRAALMALAPETPGAKKPRDYLLDFCIQALTVFLKTCYRDSGSRNLVISRSLELLPLYTLTARKMIYASLDMGMEGNETMRRIVRMPVHGIMASLYPRVYPLLPALSEGDEDGLRRLTPEREALQYAPACLVATGLNAWILRGTEQTQPETEPGDDLLERATGLWRSISLSLQPSHWQPLRHLPSTALGREATRRERGLVATLFVEDEGFTEMSYTDWVYYLHGQVQRAQNSCGF